jgi:hypothetical protein
MVVTVIYIYKLILLSFLIQVFIMSAPAIITPVQLPDQVKVNTEIYDYMLKKTKVIVIQTDDECTKTCTLYLNDPVKVLGFDVEFGPAIMQGHVIRHGKQYAAATVQLSNGSTTCVIQMNLLTDSTNLKLKELLEDITIIKVGVACTNDSKVINNTCDIDTVGCVELPLLATIVCNDPLLRSYGLARLTKRFLNLDLPKTRELRCGNWTADNLSKDKITYAAADAFVAFEIYNKIISMKEQDDDIPAIIQSIMDIKVKSKDLNSSANNGNGNISEHKKNRQLLISNPAYDNCLVKTSNGQTGWYTKRSRCDWYIKRGLASIIQEDPYIIQLKFETKLQKAGLVDLHLIDAKKNICVACGSGNQLNRYNIIGKGAVLSNSHDSVFLCNRCMSVMTRAADNLLDKLLDKYNCRQGYINYCEDYKKKKKHITLANGILSNNTPQMVKDKMKTELYDYCKENNVDGIDIDNMDLNKIIEINTIQYEPIVRRYIMNYVIEKDPDTHHEWRLMWRQYFLDTLKPKHMPKTWTIDYVPTIIDHNKNFNYISFDN